jgi:hypothetical protein
MNILPRRIPGSTEQLSDHLVASFLIDRMMTIEIGTSVLILLTVDEAAALYSYLHRNKRKFAKVEVE